MRITTAVARKLGWYVYAYVNPIDDRVFYVGKGHGKRVLQHLDARGRSPTAAMVRAIRRARFEPRLEILAHGLPDQQAALRVETAVIDAVGLKTLVNRVRGWRALESGRVPLNELVAFYEKRQVTVKEPAVLIRVNRLYQPGMTASELYDATRASWKVSRRRGSQVQLALAVFEGVVREVYEVAAWLPSGSTFTNRYPRGRSVRGRWEFVGRVAPERIRRRYVDRFVGFSRGARNPISYVNITKGRLHGRRSIKSDWQVPFLPIPTREVE